MVMFAKKPRLDQKPKQGENFMDGRNPHGDGKIKSLIDAVIRACVVAFALFLSWQAPFAWYWRVAVFFVIMFIVGIIYPAVQMAWAVRRERRLLDTTKPVDPTYEQLLELFPATKSFHQETREFEARMNAKSKALGNRNK